uniref:Phage protein n=1 Tax=Loa loa TaxID=7209 RepID=A0A1I7W121_LOALO
MLLNKDKKTKAYTCPQSCTQIDTRVLENIRTMLDNANSRHPECHSALTAYGLSRLNINIADLSEVRLYKDDTPNGHGTSYTLYWQEKPKVTFQELVHD